MAKWGLLLARLAKCNIPFCAGCCFGKLRRKPWRTKTKPKVTPKQVSAPGECVSIDQLEATTPGLIGQIKGWLINKRYAAATIFVDHASSLSYVYIHQSLTSEETVKAKQAFEAYAKAHGVKILHYHADNG